MNEQPTNGHLWMAIQFAVYHHANAWDKAGDLYILHPLRVMSNFSDNLHRIVAVLHDVVEGTAATLDEIRHKFGPEVAAAVDAITHREGEPRKAYLERVCQNPIATKVKWFDVRDNCNRLHNLDFETRERLFAKYGEAQAQLTVAMEKFGIW